MDDALAVTLRLARTLKELGVPFLVGGSLASSFHGIPRLTQDADVVAGIEPHHAGPLVEALQGDFYVDLERVHEAIRSRSSFNVIELRSMFKVDIFVRRDDALARKAFERRIVAKVGEKPDDSLPLASAEDIVLEKLRWYRLGRGVSERQWLDVLGVLRVSAGRLDIAYLRHWAAEIEVADLLEEALLEAAQSE